MLSVVNKRKSISAAFGTNIGRKAIGEKSPFCDHFWQKHLLSVEREALREPLVETHSFRSLALNRKKKTLSFDHYLSACLLNDGGPQAYRLARGRGLPSWTACTSTPLSEIDWLFRRSDRRRRQRRPTRRRRRRQWLRRCSAREKFPPLPSAAVAAIGRPLVRRSLQVPPAHVQNIPGSMAVLSNEVERVSQRMQPTTRVP